MLEIYFVNFVKRSERLYGRDFVSYNVHNLMHLIADVERFGTLYSFSAYRFEHFYGTIKQYLRKNDKPLQQLVKRLNEEQNSKIHTSTKSNLVNGSFKFSKICLNGSLPNGCHGQQFKVLDRVGSYRLTCNKPDNCCFLTNKSVVVLENFVKTGCGQSLAIGRQFIIQTNFYETPLPSSSIDEFLVSQLSHIRSWNVSEILRKAVLLPTTQTQDEFVAFPLQRH